MHGNLNMSDKLNKDFYGLKIEKEKDNTYVSTVEHSSFLFLLEHLRVLKDQIKALVEFDYFLTRKYFQISVQFRKNIFFVFFIIN